MTDYVSRLKTADITAYPALRGLDGHVQVLWVLLVAREVLGEVWLTPHHISIILRDAYGISMSRQRVMAILEGEKGTVARKRIKGQGHYQIMEAGRELVVRSGPDALFIDPEKALSGIRSVESLLGSLEGDVRLCDPYVDGRSLDLIAQMVKAKSVQLLTANVTNPGSFKRDLQAYRKEHKVPIEVRQATTKALHDRYAIDDAGMLVIGTSLNGIGKKQTFVVRVGQDLRSVAITAFDGVWSGANPL